MSKAWIDANVAEESGVSVVAPGRSRRGFASMDPERRREIASKGGKSAHAQGVAYAFTPEHAREAGRKGGLAYHKKRGRVVIEGEGQERLPEVEE